MSSASLSLLIFLLPASIFAQNRHDVVIDELMADPAPQMGLPNNEWLELKNTSTGPINLFNWRIGDGTGQSGLLPSFTLQADSFVIICSGAAAAAMSAFGSTISVTSFPSLENDGEVLYLKAANGRTIHAIAYSSSWYQNEIKKEGGWTLEMIDTKNPCAGSGNWKAGTNTTGGTPGRKNSIDSVNNDQTIPRLKNAYTIDNTTIVLAYDEPVDSLTGATPANYSMDGGLSFSNAVALGPLFDHVQLKVTAPMAENIIYTITANNVKDCKGNLIGAANKVKLGLPSEVAPGELLINEILFNPKPNGYDYIEFYNKSNKIFDASKLYIANRNGSGVISSIRPLSSTPRYIFPADYIVVTEDADNLALNFLVEKPGNALIQSSLPSFPDDEGDVIVLNFQGEVIDEVKYKGDWHFKLIDNDEGVALERIDPEGPSQEASNWHSAASTAGYGTPTYKNSQFKQPPGIDATIEISPKVFSPDNDGFDDIATIQYKIDEPGYVANLIIFDASGRPVRNLVRNGTLALSGYWNWDGLDEKGKKLPVGVYILFTEIYNLQGKKDKFKNTLVLARKF